MIVCDVPSFPGYFWQNRIRQNNIIINLLDFNLMKLVEFFEFCLPAFLDLECWLLSELC